jgi:putative FmdB family regulatory protein
MPTYEYRCENGHNFDVFRRMADDPVTACEECGAPVERVFNPVAVHFKGSGFYTTDYARKDNNSAASDSKDGAGGDTDGAGNKNGADKKDSKKSEGKGKDAKSSGEKAKANSD